ncbi:MAG: AbiH family protein [Bacteroidales bacterium]
MEQLIILGNGFDLACNLRSRYEDFYNSRYKKSLTDKIDNI